MKVAIVQDIIDSIRFFVPLKKLNNRIKKAKYVHVMFNDKFNKPFVDFLNEYFNPNEHIILCKNLHIHPFPQGDNVIKIKSLKGLKFDNNEKVICHSLFDCELVDYLFNHKNILKNKAYWIIWGGDLYNALPDDKNDYVRENFKGYITGGDRIYLQQKYNIKNRNFFNVPYIFPISKYMLDKAQKHPHDYIKIQINNSADNSTIEMLDVLSRFKNENIKITTILSYGKTEYKDQIIKKGQKIFGDKFEYEDEYMPAEQYTNYLAQNDILILNQNRQQGVGNTYAALYLENKVFIRKDILTFKAFNDIGVRIYPTDDIKNMSFEEFIKNDSKVKSKNIIEHEVYNQKHLAELWGNVFLSQ